MSELCHSACMLFCLFDFPASLHHLLPACAADQLTQQSGRVLQVCYIMSGMQKHKLNLMSSVRTKSFHYSFSLL